MTQEEFKNAERVLPKDHPLRIQLEEAKCGLHNMNMMIAHQNMRIANIMEKIMEVSKELNHEETGHNNQSTAE